jgi:hypothetical protein
MGYKYRQGSTPDHVDSSMSNPTKPNVGLPMSSDSTKKYNPDDAVKSAFRDAQAKGDTAQMRRITDRVSQPKEKPDPNAKTKEYIMQQGSHMPLKEISDSISVMQSRLKSKK